jgi:Domain of unknown function (DUF1998)
MPPGGFQELDEMRRSQVVTTFGPGSIVDFRAGRNGGAPISVIAAGLDAWDESAGQNGQAGINHPQVIKEPRLQKILGVDGFRLPPAVPKDPDGNYINSQRLVGIRFPDWLQCPECKILQPSDGWTQDPGDPALYCASCSHNLGRRRHVFPVRFITVCPGGHLDEFPWRSWAEHSSNCKRKDGPLKLEARGPGLAGLMLVCTKCGQSRSMDGCFSKNALSGHRCRGQRHWLGDAEQCTEASPPRALLRGATNVYFPVIVSALDIPPWSNEFHKKIPPLDWARLKNAPNDAKRRSLIEANDMHASQGMSVDEMLAEVIRCLQTLEAGGADTLLLEEYRQLCSDGFGPIDRESEFEIHSETVPPELSHMISRLVRVTRLREVRAVKAFTRLKPPADWRETPGARIPFSPLSREKKNWLPAIEVRGEGIFLELDRAGLARWLLPPAGTVVLERAAALQAAFEEDYRERYGVELPIRVTPRLLLIHSLAHALIRQLSLDCGYSTASLRERIYVDDGERDMCGLLIYTASADADGTLGGLCRQGSADRLIHLLRRAIRSCEWCSSDPLCIQGLQSSSELLNHAACHSCMLLPETSCEKFNRLLDRAMLVGLPVPASGDAPWHGDVGFFRPLLTGGGR